METMRERIARAIGDVMEARGGPANMADAALDAMREPTEAMVAAAYKKYGGELDCGSSGRSLSKDVFQAMIDAAKAEGDDGK